MTGRILLSIFTCGLLASSLPQASQALPVAPLQAQTAGMSDITTVQNKQQHKQQQKNVNRNVNKNANVNRNVKVNNNKTVVRNNKTVVHRNVTVKKTVYVKPYRAWGYRPYYGTIIGGVALGTVIGVSAAYAAPVRPAPNLCWYWADPAGYRGYWDYCY
jgi:hypothetical protein